MLAAKTAAPAATSTKASTPEAAGGHASPATAAFGSRRPTARTAEAAGAGVTAHTAKRVRISRSSSIVLRPGVRGRRMIGVDVYRVSTHILVVGVATGFVVAILGGRFVVIIVIVAIVFISVVIG